MHVHAGIPVQGVPDEAVFPARQGIDDQCFDGFPPAGDAEGRGVIIVHPFLGLDREFEFQRFRPFFFYFPQNRVGYLPLGRNGDRAGDGFSCIPGSHDERGARFLAQRAFNGKGYLHRFPDDAVSGGFHVLKGQVREGIRAACGNDEQGDAPGAHALGLRQHGG